MKRVALFIALAFTAGIALADNCTDEMKVVDTALPKADLPADKIAEVKKLRAQGEELHKAGKHDDSVAALGKAKRALGIK
jgi:hypothetical protein